MAQDQLLSSDPSAGLLSTDPSAADAAVTPKPRDLGAELQAMQNHHDDHESLLDKASHVVNSWAQEGPRRVRQGLEELGLHVFTPIAGQYPERNITRGLHDVAVGSGVTALPMVAPALAGEVAAAPVAAATTVAGGIAGQQIAQRGAKALGANDDVQNLAGDAGALLGGGMANQAREWTTDQISAWNQTRQAAAATKANAQQITSMIKAVPPTHGTPWTLADFSRAKPYLDAEHSGAPITSVQGLRDASDSAISKIEQTVKGHITRFGQQPLTVDVLNTVRRDLGTNVRGSFVEAGLKELDDLGLDQPLTVARADQIRSQLNAENKANLARNNYDQATAAKADPAFAARNVAASTLRDAIYTFLDQHGVPGVAEMRRDEGALIKFRNAAQRQIFSGEKTVGGTGNTTLPRRIIASAVKHGSTVVGASVGGPGGALVGQELGADVAGAIAKPNQTRDALIEKVFSK